MTRQLVFLHGRSQQMKDSVALKAEWVKSFKRGLAKNGLTLPISDANIRFPYYGDTLYELVQGESAAAASEVVIRGTKADADEKRFTRAILEEMRKKAKITEAELAAIAGQEVVDRGPQNREWFQAMLQAVDRHVPFGSGSSIALFAHDVYVYLKNASVRGMIDTGVGAAMTPGVEAVVVSHSLGTVVAYNVLRHNAQARGWKIPLFVTLGSPLAVTEIRRTLRNLATARCPEGVSKWFNALDERDVIALYPLDADSFPLDPTTPSIENKCDVDNTTENRHGIAGYLDDADVARRIHEALTD
ncbi:hypothetical protein AWB68_05864 [Caballeronia choica]|uniref:Alpha/beta hydrolase n=1 Tax=Caballeronia choica TaxID=326476 RepID=A0A158KIS0_9BURK|nr:hypothetical protein [Caballeronia choica]SAL80470.1 hypothetical protein AWB68_05864 [Caballeronia choica]